MSDLKDRMLAPRIPDLTKPSLEGMAYLLRHRELWPNGFQWYFGDCWNCAIGLGWRAKWGASWYHPLTRNALDVHKAFFEGGPGKTPEMVADEIDAYLSKLPK